MEFKRNFKLERILKEKTSRVNITATNHAKKVNNKARVDFDNAINDAYVGTSFLLENNKGNTLEIKTGNLSYDKKIPKYNIYHITAFEQRTDNNYVRYFTIHHNPKKRNEFTIGPKASAKFLKEKGYKLQKKSKEAINVILQHNTRVA